MDDKISKTFCRVPFYHLNMKQNGIVTCCWRSSAPVGNIYENTLSEIWANDNIIKIRKMLMNNEKPEECRLCWKQEKDTKTSPRILYNSRKRFVDYHEIFKNYGNSGKLPIKSLLSVELRFSKKCNLMCRHCSPMYSSVWESRIKEIETDLENVGYKYKSTPMNTPQSVLDEILTMLPHMKEIKISGGEPLLSNKHKLFIKKISESNFAKKICLNYNSNLNIPNIDEYIKIWGKFKKIIFRVSVDGCPSIYDYVRQNGNIDMVTQNTLKMIEMKNIDLYYTFTANMYNITRLKESIIFSIKNNVYFDASIVNEPQFLNITTLPQKMKIDLTRELEEFVNNDIDYILNKHFTKSKEFAKERILTFTKNLLKHMNGLDTYQNNFNRFTKYTEILDKFHNKQFEKYYPEFAEFVIFDKGI